MVVEALLGYGTAALFAGLAAWVLGARAKEPPNRALALLLLLLAGSTAAFTAYRGATTAGDAVLFYRAIVWYELALPLALLLVADVVLVGRPRPRWWSLTLLGTAVVTASLLVLHALAPGLFVEDVTRRFGARFRVAPGPLAIVHGMLDVLAKVLVVALAARAATQPGRSVLQRRQGALMGAGVALLVAHAGALDLLLIVRAVALQALTLSGEQFVLALRIVGLFLVVGLVTRLRAPFDARSARVLAAAVALAALAGAFDAALIFIEGASGAPALPGYSNSRPLWIAAFACTLAVAVLRYGLAGIRVKGPEGLEGVTRASMALAVGGAGAAASVLVLGSGAAGVGGAVLALGATPLLFVGPLRRLPSRVAAHVLLEPEGLEVARERVRVYEGALHASLGPEGNVGEAHGAVLAALRAELGLTDADHELLLARARAAPAAGRPLVLLGRYVVLRELGKGATSVAYLARDSVLGREVVVKRLTGLGDHAHAFAAEAGALAEVKHPRLVRMFSAARAGHEVLLVLEHVPGGSLEDRLLRDGPLPSREAVRLSDEVLEALSAVHAAGLVHGDVKAANVLLARDGHAKLSDLGAVRRPPARAGHTQRLGSAMGSLSGMAPEQVLGKAADPRTDLYAAGALLYRLLTGEHYVALEGATEAEARGRILHDPPRLPHARVPAALEPGLRAALAKDPAQRPADAEALRGMLGASVRLTPP